MAGFISVDVNGEERTWSSANWIFAGFLDHAIEAISEDQLAVHELNVGKYNQCLSLNEIAKENVALHDRLLKTVLRTCELVSAGHLLAYVEGRQLAEESQVQFREAVGELLTFLKHGCETETGQ